MRGPQEEPMHGIQCGLVMLTSSSDSDSRVGQNSLSYRVVFKWGLFKTLMQ